MQSLTNGPAIRELDFDAVAASSTEAQRPERAFLGWVGALLVVALFAGYIALNFAPAITEPDDNGYFAQATRWVRGGTTWFKSSSDAEYIGMHWLWDKQSNTYVSRYPPGLPAFIAVLYKLGGYQIAMLANPILAVLSLVGFYFTARRLIAVPWALTGVVLLATNPTFIGHTLAGDSHMAVTFCLIWGTGFLLLWQRSGWMWQIFLAGLVLGCVPTIRYPDSLVALGVGAFIVITLWRSRNYSLAPVPGGEGRGEGVRTSERQFASATDRPLTLTLSPDYRGEGTRIARPLAHLIAAVVGALIPIVPLLVRNQLVLGGFWKTGYALTNEQTGFSVDYFKQHAIQYVQIIQGDGLGIVFALGLVGIAWMICVKGTRALGIMLTLFVVPMLVLYMAYYWAPAGNSAATMRFLLPIFPAMLLAGMWMLATATRSAPRAVFIAVPLVLVGYQLLWGTSDTMQRVDRMSVSKRALTILTEELRKTAARDDVVITTGGMLQHADFVREWKLADMSMISGRGGGGPGGGGPGGGGFGGGPNGRGGNDANAPSPMQMEKQQMLRSLYPGTTKQKLEKFAIDVSKWKGDSASSASKSDSSVTSDARSATGDAHAIFILCPESELRSTFGRDNADLTIVKTIELPKRPTPPAQPAGFGGGPGGGMGGPGGNFGGPPGMGMGGPGAGMGGPGGGRQGGGGGGGGGGMMGMQNLDGTTWVLARWNPTPPTPTPEAPASEPPVSEQSPATQPTERVVSIDVNR